MTPCPPPPALLLVASITIAAPLAAGAQPSVARAGAGLDTALLRAAYAHAAELPRMRSLLVSWRGELVGERYFRGATRSTPANIKSASKSIISALVGIAIAEGRIRGVRQTIGELLPEATRGLDARKRAITVEDLLTMRAGLESTSFGNYGAWVSSRNWVRDALRRPLVAEPGGPMIYSTGSSHLLSAILTRATRSSTHAYGDRKLARPLGFRLRAWTRDPQGIYFGGNEMRMTPRELLAFGRLYLNRGRTASGRQVIPRAWVDSSWVPRTISGWSGNAYGYGWWMRDVVTERGQYRVYFAWGYGGQFVFVVPELQLVVVATSDASATRREGAHLSAVHALLDQLIVPAVEL